jgi:toxin FitB
VKGWLLDTNVISELYRPRANDAVKSFVAGQPGEVLFVSDITIAEIRFGIEQLDDARRRADLTLWLDRTLRPVFEGRILPIGEDVILRWKMLHVAGQKRRHTFSQPDLFIAALAVVEDLVVVSRDISEFIAADVPVFDPWSFTLHTGGKALSLETPVTLDIVASATRRRKTKSTP